MSRFHNLEFNEPQHGQRDRAAITKDEAYYADEARLALEAGRFEKALRAHAKVLEYNPRNAVAWVGQVRMLVELGEFKEAGLWADKALEVLPDHPELLAAKAVTLARLGDTQAAMAYTDAAISCPGHTPFVWLARADVLLARQDRKADYCVDKALALAGADWIHLWLVSRMHAFYRQFAKALQFAQRAVETASDRAVVWLQLGVCRRELGMLGPARAAMETAQQLDADLVEADRALNALGSGAGVWMTGLWRRWFGR